MRLKIKKAPLSKGRQPQRQSAVSLRQSIRVSAILSSHLSSVVHSRERPIFEKTNTEMIHILLHFNHTSFSVTCVRLKPQQKECHTVCPATPLFFLNREVTWGRFNHYICRIRKWVKTADNATTDLEKPVTQIRLEDNTSLRVYTKDNVHIVLHIHSFYTPLGK